MPLLDAAGKPIIKPADPIITDLKILRKMSKPTTWDKVRELNLVDRLKASNDTAWTKGVGLAAMQIGEFVRMAWFINGEEDVVMVNPVIIKADKHIIVPKEGCLSIPHIWSQTRRYLNITVRMTAEDQKEPITRDFEGFPAIVVQHEIDHMNGVVNLQRRYFPPKVVGRNQPCPCKSGKKYKKCCIDKLSQPGAELKPLGEEDETKRSGDSKERKRGLGEMLGLGKRRGRDSSS